MANAIRVAVNDIVAGARLAPLWTRLGWEQTVARFRRTVLGPFWLSAGLLATSIALAVVFGGLLGQNIHDIFPLIISGILAWSIIGGVIGEAANVFINSAALLQTQTLPKSFYVYLMMMRILINFIAQMISFWVVVAGMGAFVFPTWHLLLALPLILVTSFFMSIIVAVPATRFRDINQMIQFLVQILFFLTPIFWFPSQMSAHRRFMVEYNPFFHMLEIIRQPLLGRAPAAEHWIWSVGVLVFSAVAAVVVLAGFRKRIVFWL
jgi:ABC-type polysaccharide/polyol phosphate export permease